VEAYLSDREAEGSNTAQKDRAAMAAHLPESLASVSLERLSSSS